MSPQTLDALRSVPCLLLCCVLLASTAGIAGGAAGPAPAGTGATETVAPTPAQPARTAGADAGETAAPNRTDGAVVGGTLSVDPTVVYRRVERLRNKTVPVPVTVRLIAEENATVTRSTTRFEDAMGLEANATDSTFLGTANGTHITLNRDAIQNMSASRIRGIIAHEYLHVLQIHHGFPWTDGPYDGDTISPEENLLQTAAIEGAATYTAETYLDRYENGTVSQVARHRSDYRNASGAAALADAPYLFGARWYDTRVDSPAALDRAYAAPPRSTEELIHGLRGGTEPAGDLTVTVDAGDWAAVNRTMMGELWLRTALLTSLNRSTAARGADGWNTDRRLWLTRQDTAAFVWVIRWDDTANATEFERAFARFLTARPDVTAERGVQQSDTAAYRLAPAGDRTTVLFVGPRRFVQNASTSVPSDDATVAIELPAVSTPTPTAATTTAPSVTPTTGSHTTTTRSSVSDGETTTGTAGFTAWAVVVATVLTTGVLVRRRLD